MNRHDFQMMARQYFYRMTPPKPGGLTITATVDQLADFARQVYELGEANGRYDEQIRSQHD